MKGVRNLKLWLNRASPTILSAIGAIGVLTTAATAITATPKALELIRHDSRENHDGDPYAYTNLEAFKSAWKCYIPTVTLAVSTIACILGANALNKRQQAALTSAYMLLNNTYKDLVKKDASKTIQKAVVKDKVIENDVHSENEQCLFYEFNYGDFFECGLGEILSAEYRLNQLFVKSGYVTLNDFYELLGLPKTKEGEILGWSRDDGHPLVDFEHELVELEDGMECYFIYLPEYPTPNYIDSRKMHMALWKGGK